MTANVDAQLERENCQRPFRYLVVMGSGGIVVDGRVKDEDEERDEGWSAENPGHRLKTQMAKALDDGGHY